MPIIKPRTGRMLSYGLPGIAGLFACPHAGNQQQVGKCFLRPRRADPQGTFVTTILLVHPHETINEQEQEDCTEDVSISAFNYE